MENNRSHTNLRAFGKHLRRLRERKGLSQEKLAWAAGSYQSTVWRIEQGLADPKLSSLIAIAKAMNTKLSELTDFLLEP